MNATQRLQALAAKMKEMEDELISIKTQMIDEEGYDEESLGVESCDEIQDHICDAAILINNLVEELLEDA